MAGLDIWADREVLIDNDPGVFNGSSAALSTGGYVVAAQSTGSPVEVRFLDAAGDPFAPPVSIWNGVSSSNTSLGVVDVATLSDGRVVVAYPAPDATSVDEIYIQLFNSDGTVSGVPIHVNQTIQNSQIRPVITPLEGGRFLVTWEGSDALGGDTSASAVYGRIFRSDGSSIGDEFQLNQNTAGNQFQATSIATDYGFLSMWQSQSAVIVRAFDADGSPLGGERVISALNSMPQDLMRLSDGRVGVLWKTGTSLNLSVVDERGAATPPVTLVTGVTGDAGFFGNHAAVEALADGGFMVASLNVGETTLSVRRFTADGVQEGATVDFPTSIGITPDLETLADGRVVLSFRSALELETVIFDPRDHAVQLTGTSAAEELHGTAWNDRMDGNAGSDSLYGADGSDRLNGGAGADVLDGGDGNDTLNGGGGADSFVGGAGVDTVAYGTATRGVTATLADPWVNTGEAYGDTYDGIENLYGSRFADILVGNGNANVLTGGAGADTLAGADGDDTYYVDNVGDVVFEEAAEGADRIFSSVSYVLPDNVERLILTGSADIDGAGGLGADMIYGNSGANWLHGHDGNDRLDGGAGADELEGGLGDDIYYVDNAGDVAVEMAAEGFDRVFATASHTLADNVERLDLTGSADLDASGNDGANTLGGNAGANHLQGRAGADTLIGNDGDDILDGGADKDRLIGGNGDDTFVFAGSWGRDTIIDFQAGEGSEDVIQLDAAQFADFDAVLAAITYNSAGEVMINSGVSVIVLNGVMAGQLHADDFVFVSMEDGRAASPALTDGGDWLVGG